MSLTKILAFFSILTIVACSKEDGLDANPQSTGTENQDPENNPDPNNDGGDQNNDADQNSNGTMGDPNELYTYQGIKFTPVIRDFSSQSKITTPQTVNAVLEKTYDLRNYSMRHVTVMNDTLYATKLEGAFVDNRVTVNELPTLTEISKQSEGIVGQGSVAISGFATNGPLAVSINGGENLNFYQVENGVVKPKFHQIVGFQQSKFLGGCYLYKDKLYMENGDKIIYFSFNEPSKVEILPNVSSSVIYPFKFSSDENYLYTSTYFFVAGGSSTSVITVLDADNDHQIVKTMSLQGKEIVAICVDANYIYLADNVDGKILVINKYTYADAGTFSVPELVRSMDIDQDNLYIATSSSAKTLLRYKISFQ